MGDTMPEASTVQVLVALVALGGLSLSLYNTFRLRRQDRRVVKMSMQQKTIACEGRLGSSFLCLRATNVGYRDVTIEHIQLQVPDGRHLALMETGAQVGLEDTPLPATLVDGQSACAYISYGSIGRTLLRGDHPDTVMLTAACVDSVGGRYLSEPLTITPSDWVNK